MRYIIVLIVVGLIIAIFNYYPKYTAKKSQEAIQTSLKVGMFSNTVSILVPSRIEPYVTLTKDINYPKADFNIMLKDGQQELKVEQPEALKGQIALDLCHDFNKKFLVVV